MKVTLSFRHHISRGIECRALKLSELTLLPPWHRNSTIQHNYDPLPEASVHCSYGLNHAWAQQHLAFLWGSASTTKRYVYPQPVVHSHDRHIRMRANRTDAIGTHTTAHTANGSQYPYWNRHHASDTLRRISGRRYRNTNAVLVYLSTRHALKRATHYGRTDAVITHHGRAVEREGQKRANAARAPVLTVRHDAG